MIKYWREILIFILGLGLAFIAGRGFESNYVQKLIFERQQLLQLKQQTEIIIARDGNEATIQVFRNLGYTILPDSLR